MKAGVHRAARASSRAREMAPEIPVAAVVSRIVSLGFGSTPKPVRREKSGEEEDQNRFSPGPASAKGCGSLRSGPQTNRDVSPPCQRMACDGTLRLVIKAANMMLRLYAAGP